MPALESEHQRPAPTLARAHTHTRVVYYSQGQRQSYIPRTKMDDFGIDDIDEEQSYS